MISLLKEQGKKIRKYYWSFNEKGIKEEADRQYKEEPYLIYQKIPKSAWLTHLQNT